MAIGSGVKTDAGAGGRRTDPHVGTILSQTRLALGQSLNDVSRDLRIRRAFLEAIEDGRYDGLPGTAYTLGFIRTYAEHLGLEGDEIVRRFKNESGQVAPKSKLNFPSPMSESTAPKAAVLLIGAVIAILAYGIWYLSSNRYLDVAELVVPLPEHLRKMLPGDGHGVVAPVPPAAPSPASSQLQAAEMPSPSSPAAALAPSEPPAPAEVNTAAAPPATMPAAPASPPPTVATATATDGSSRVVLTANADSWVEVREAGTRTPLLSRLMRAGETFAVPDRPGLTLMTGNAGGLDVTVDGQQVAPLGKTGAVRRAVSLDPDRLKAEPTAAN